MRARARYKLSATIRAVKRESERARSSAINVVRERALTDLAGV